MTDPIEELAAENRALRSRMAWMLEQAERNHDIMMRHQSFDLEIVGATSFPELIGSIFRLLPAISELERVTLSLVDEGADIRTVMERLGVDLAAYPDLLFVAGTDQLGLEAVPKPLLGAHDAVRDGGRFPAAAGLQSVAIVPLLRNKRVIGTLNLGSADPSRFTPSLGTDFVEHMASIIAICLENVISNEMLKYIGLTDSLTGVYNRRYLDRRLLEEIARARRQRYDLSFMYIDIDHFKRINDTLGHQAGDEVLREVAARIKGELRVSDALARFGGEEFVVVLIDADLDSAAFVAERIRTAISATMIDLAGGLKVSITGSIGVACLAVAQEESGVGVPAEVAARELIAQADEALYQAKAGGRDRVVRHAGH
jgi:two-component system, cell cycle response regulator